MTRSRRGLAALSALLAVATVVAACSSAPVEVHGPGSDPVAATSSTLPPGVEVLHGAPFSAVRCQLNRAAGPIKFLTNHSLAASAGIIEVITAADLGLYQQLCLDVQIVPSFAADNYAKIAADDAQVAAASSFSEIVDFAGRNDAKYLTLTVDGRDPLDQLFVRDSELNNGTLGEIRGRTIGVYGAINPAVAAMLDQVGITAKDYTIKPMKTFDPVGNIDDPDVIGITGTKSDTGLLLESSGAKYTTFDPDRFGIAGSFGVTYTSTTFVQRAPTAAEDFVRATLRGLAVAMERPDEAADRVFDQLEAQGNDLHSSRAQERRRWQIESEIIRTGSTSTEPLGVPLVARLTQAVATYAAIGLFGGIVPDVKAMVADSLVRGVYDSQGQIIWPSETGAS